jgi:hypothetical protein
MSERITLGTDEEFSRLCWPLTDEEKALLRASLKAEGCREPIRFWEADGRPVLDGHNRLEICLEEGIDYPMLPMQFPDRQKAIEWVIHNQLGRRNASEVQKSHLRGMLYIEKKTQAEKAENASYHSGIRGTEDGDGKQVSDEKLPAPPTRPNFAKQVAAETGVSEQKVHRDAKFTNALNRLALKSPKLRDAVLNEEISKKDVDVLASASAETLKPIESVAPAERRAAAHAVAEAVRTHKAAKPANGKPLAHPAILDDLEKILGTVVRAKSDVMNNCIKGCGGEQIKWVKEHADAIRYHLNEIFDELQAWKKNVVKHMGNL